MRKVWVHAKSGDRNRGARGIGRACALALARAGYDIALVDLLAPETERTANEIRGLSRDVMTFEADTSLFGRAQEIADAVMTQLGRIDFLLNNAGKPMPKGVLRARRSSTGWLPSPSRR